MRIDIYKRAGIMRLFYILCFTFTTLTLLTAQDKTMVQIKVFDQQLAPLSNQAVSLNGKPFISVGNKGVAFVEVPLSDLPPKSIVISDEESEAESWNYSKGVLEIIIRKKSYQTTQWKLVNDQREIIPNAKVEFKGKRSQSLRTDANGGFTLQLALDEQVTNTSLFVVNGYDVVSVGSNILTVKTLASAASPKSDEQAVPFKNFDLSKLDSIQSLTVFYAIFKNYQISDFTPEQKRKIDEKFKQLMKDMQDSIKQSDLFIGKISESSLLQEDMNNLIAQAKEEKELLRNQRAGFDQKLQILSDKLTTNVEKLDDGTRKGVLTDINVLERLLLENENQFYKNQSDYRNMISSLKEKYFDITSLENRLSESELQRLKEKEVFQKRLLLIVSISIVFAFLIILLLRVSGNLRKHKKKLEEANAEIKRINENLEVLVYVRTKLLAEAHKELDTFLYRASHDLRSPICSIIGLCNIASSQLPSGDSRELIHRVVTTTENMDKLLKKLSLISEINQPSDFSEINLCKAITSVQQRFIGIIKEHHIKFSIECDPNLILHSYPNLISAILTNTIENALYYSSLKHSRGAVVEVQAVRDGDRVKITIYDNGIGLDDISRPKIFDMFYKGNIRSKGNGLGLYIVQKSLQALEGEIKVESVYEEYTKFTMLIPANPVAPVTVLEKELQEA